MRIFALKVNQVSLISFAADMKTRSRSADTGDIAVVWRIFGWARKQQIGVLSKKDFLPPNNHLVSISSGDLTPYIPRTARIFR
jgi:hypothetical protein